MRLFQTRIKKKISLWIPYTWLLLFLVLPFLVIFKISISELAVGIPPYKPFIQIVDGELLQIRMVFSNYSSILCDGFYRTAFFNSIKIAALATMMCVLIGYPMAYGIAQSSKKMQKVFLILAILPFWTSFLVRVYAWMNLLGDRGIINFLLVNIGLIREPLELLNNQLAVGIGVTYTYLPFMIFPAYVSLENIDRSLLEAAFDLGCKPTSVFWRITVPMSLPGLVAGASLVFIPAMGEYVIPELLGGPTSLMIGRVLWAEFFTSKDWPSACALAVIMVALLLIPMILFEKLQTAINKDKD
ncbi:ABC transporter permease subunit [Candidatus Hydrogenosomobacter endosymbioticus]|uniref:ABC transporter permease subunit n=1 Tax=Candidatus Hydrogenosomobacter endosymbioticus TaxID=2558174 RepID=UPI001EFFA496|nr:ABC transporter permease subunit [Candidatus Hydrogenosomobacter endosymbioticus]